MSIENKIKAQFAKLSSEVEDHFDDLKAEIERRFGKRRSREEVFRALPAPAGLTMSLGEALAKRCSERNFSNEPLPDPLLANLLYAADGINRPNGRRTTPSAFNWRETEIYVLKPNGIWRWVPERNGLERTRDLVMRLASLIVDKVKRSDWTEDVLEEARLRSTHLDVGLKLQSVSLAAAAMGLACVPRTGFLVKKLNQRLHLKPTESVVAVQSIGYPAKSVLDHFL